MPRWLEYRKQEPYDTTSTATRELSYYEIWLVGQAVFADYVLALQGIVEDLQDSTALSQAA